jgi:hypothetical membrane protein
MMRGLSICGAIGPMVFIAVFTIAGWLRPDYSARRHYISTLSTGPRGWVQIVNFVQCGALVLCGALGMGGHPGAVRWALGVHAIGLILAGAFVTGAVVTSSPSDYAKQIAAPGSRASTLHNVATAVVFASLLVAICVTAVQSARAGRTAWAIGSAAAFVGVIAGFVGNGALLKAEVEGKIANAPLGTYQRLAVISGWTWVAAVSAHAAGAW